MGGAGQAPEVKPRPTEQFEPRQRHRLQAPAPATAEGRPAGRSKSQSYRLRLIFACLVVVYTGVPVFLPLNDCGQTTLPAKDYAGISTSCR